MSIIERRADFKKRLRSRQQLFAGWTSLGHPSIADMLCRAGLDFIGIDIEHSTISLEQSQNIIATCQGNGVICLPRIASHNPEMIKRILDSGADGLIVPMVSTPEEVEKLIAWSKYPPAGRRNFGIARAQGYGFDFDEYVDVWNESSTLIIQIESMEGVENVEKMLQFEEVDGVMLGPYDLSGGMGIPGQINDPKILEASRHVAEVCAKYGRACGTHLVEPDEKRLHACVDDGHTFTVIDSDIFMMWKWGERIGAMINNVKKT